MSDLLGIEPPTRAIEVPTRSTGLIPTPTMRPAPGAPGRTTWPIDLTSMVELDDLVVLAPADVDPGRGRSPSSAGAITVDHAVAVSSPDDAHLEVLAERWLTPRERSVADVKGPRARVGHILGRVAAKQALLAQLDARDFGETDARRVEIINDAHGCPRVGVRGARVGARHLAVSIAHTGSVAVALATAGARRTGDHLELGPGIDIEAIEPRSSRFERLALTATERALTPIDGDDRDTWLTRIWSAKEAAAKATGRGLRGRPKDFVVTEAEAEGGRLRIADRWIVTEPIEIAGAIHVIATTDSHRTECSWRS